MTLTRSDASNPPLANVCKCPGPGLPGDRRKLTLAGRAIAPKVSFLPPPRTHTDGHFRSSNRPADSFANDRFQGYGRHRPAAARTCTFYKAVAQSLAALAGTLCKPYVRRSISRTGTAGQKKRVGAAVGTPENQSTVERPCNQETGGPLTRHSTHRRSIQCQLGLSRRAWQRSHPWPALQAVEHAVGIK